MQNVLPVWELISQVCLWNNITKPPSKSHFNASDSGPTLESKGQWVRKAPRDPHKSGLHRLANEQKWLLTHTYHLAPNGGQNSLPLTLCLSSRPLEVQAAHSWRIHCPFDLDLASRCLHAFNWACAPYPDQSENFCGWLEAFSTW